jgi:hypothetical protein
MPKNPEKSTFESIDAATEHYKEIYEGLPEQVIKDVIEFCMKNPDRYPEDYENINVKKVPRPKKPIEKTIDGAVEIYDSPEDPNVKVLKHKEGATLLSAEEAAELQVKINEAIATQKAEDVEAYIEKYDAINKELLKAKLRQNIRNKRH